MSEPFFSVIMPVYNREKFVGEAIQSVLNQTFPAFELIIVDDGSTDRTRPVIESFGDSRVRYFLRSHEGVSQARNWGISQAKGDWIAFLDSDDLYLSHHLESHKKKIDQDGSARWIYSNLEFFDDSGKRQSSSKAYSGRVLEHFLKSNFLAPDCVTLKREILDAFPEAFDTRLSASEDWLLWIRLAAGFELQFISETTVLLRLHSGRSMMNVKDVERSANLFMDIVLSDPQLRAHFSIKQAKKLKSYVNLFLANSLYVAGDTRGSRDYFKRCIQACPAMVFTPDFLILVLKRLLGFKIYKTFRRTPFSKT